jgi:hypothetical protein
MLNDLDTEELEFRLSQLSKGELEELLSSVSNYDTNPVSINEFLDSPKYLGGYFEGNLYPYWRKVLNEIYPSPHHSPYWLINFRGAIGRGKTSIVCAGIAYDLHKLLCLASPQTTYGLLPSTTILFALFNVTLGLAHDVVWDKLSQIFALSPYFKDLMGPLGTKPKDQDTLFPKRIDFFMGSRISHTLGKAIYSGVFSEANFGIVGDQVYDTFNSLLRRQASRFMQPGGATPGKIWLDSSETDKFSVVNKITDQYKGKPGVYVSQDPIWEVLTHKNGVPLYSGNKFWTYTGSDLKQPFILESDQDKILIDEPENCIAVPIEHRDSFDADINAALRDIAGRATISNYKLFRLKDRLNKALCVSKLFPDTFILDFDDDNDQVSNYSLIPTYFSNPISPGVPRNIHIDIGLSGDRLGMAATYVSGFYDRTTRDANTFAEITESVPDTITEWCFGVEPTPGKQIPLWKVRNFISFLSSLGYPVGRITVDGFQGADTQQLLTKEGYDTELLSVDRTSTPYMAFRSMVYEGRSQLPSNKILKIELEELESTPDGNKVDHPEKFLNGTKGSKDIADAVCGSTFITTRDAHKTRLLHLVGNKPKHTGIGENLKDLVWPAR